ncbi:MAG: hypothetical protein IKU56_01850 [Clostridia bacterium]|nr:hypothetical protein [Clostridia bacterium]
MKKRGILAAAAGILALSLFVLAKNPVIIGGADLPQAYLTAIESQAQGIYSRNVPLVPVCVTVQSPDEETVYYTIRYFPFGRVEMSYTPSDGYNIEKPLSRLS